MRAATLATALIACLLAACGSDASTTVTRAGGRGQIKPATLMLDFTPNAVHAGIYSAIAHGYDRAAGVRLHVIAPTASTVPIKLLETGRVDFAIVDIHDLAIADQSSPTQPRIVGILPIVQRPLSAVIAAPDISSPRALQGKTVGITGVPSDTAVLRSVVAGSGGDPAKVKTITIGFNAVTDLLADRVAGATAFWNDEGQAIQSKRPGFHIFRVDEYGAPAYPELVLCAAPTTLRHAPDLVHGVVDAVERGYLYTLLHPQRSADDLERQVPGLDPSLVRAQLTGLLPAFHAPNGRIGELNAATLGAWASWEARFGIVRRAPDVAAMFDPAFAGNVG
jgi:NitT/TauT family transport system substrate-binding protein/putative hydroxymethylpyrimidine transport system substrate-binding protein